MEVGLTGCFGEVTYQLPVDPTSKDGLYKQLGLQYPFSGGPGTPTPPASPLGLSPSKSHPLWTSPGRHPLPTPTPHPHPPPARSPRWEKMVQRARQPWVKTLRLLGDSSTHLHLQGADVIPAFITATYKQGCQTPRVLPTFPWSSTEVEWDTHTPPCPSRQAEGSQGGSRSAPRDRNRAHGNAAGSKQGALGHPGC